MALKETRVIRVEITCDRPGCSTDQRVEGTRRRELICTLKKAGWKIYRPRRKGTTETFCPKCVAAEVECRERQRVAIEAAREQYRKAREAYQAVVRKHAAQKPAEPLDKAKEET